MKKIKILSIITILITSAIFHACSNDETENNIPNEVSSKKQLIQETKIPLDMGGIKFGNLLLPKGTISVISQNGSRLDFKLPKNFIYVATDKNGKVFLADSGSYTCKSTCSGCDVIRLGDNIGCSACPEGSTAACIGRRGKSTNTKKHQIGDGLNGRIVETKNSIHLIYEGEKIDNNNIKPFKFNSLIDNTKIKNEFYNFVDNFWKGKTINKHNFKKVLASVYGTTIVMYVPIDYSPNSKFLLSDGSNVSCNCDSGSSGCDLEGIYKAGGLIRIGDKCVAGSCESCTMSW
jgi:hypothetical protein